MAGDSHHVEGTDERGGPLDLLCQVIVARHHARLHRALPLIGAELVRLTEDQVPRAGSLTDARGAFVELATQLRSHLAKEETLLFPTIETLAHADREGRSRPALAFSSVLHPIRLMEAEHGRIEQAMMHLRDVVQTCAESNRDFVGWRHSLLALARLERYLHERHRVENEVLFPRALELERRLA